MQRNLWSRRQFNTLGAAGAAAFLMGTPQVSLAKELQLNEDGLVQQPWFLDSFLILHEDLAEAKANGKRFAIFWELKGCPYCKETHRVNLAKPEILDFVTSNFTVLQLNVIGSKIVTDFDGEELSERDLAAKWGVKFSPTIQFMTDDVEAAAGRPGVKNEVARIPGYFKPNHFLSMFEYVKEKAYETQKFHHYVRSKSKS